MHSQQIISYKTYTSGLAQVIDKLATRKTDKRMPIDSIRRRVAAKDHPRRISRQIDVGSDKYDKVKFGDDVIHKIEPIMSVRNAVGKLLGFKNAKAKLLESKPKGVINLVNSSKNQVNVLLEKHEEVETGLNKLKIMFRDKKTGQICKWF